MNNNHNCKMRWFCALGMAALWAGIWLPAAGQAKYQDEGRKKYVDERTRNAEVRFMSQFMDFEASAVALGKVGNNKTRHSDLRQYMDSDKDYGQRRIAKLSDWMNNWYRKDYRPIVDSKYAQRADMLSKSGMRDDEFEIRLLKTVIEHHQQEIVMIEQALPDLTHTDLREMASAVLNKRIREVSQLQSWLKNWYDISYTSEFGSRYTRPRPY